MAYIGLLSEQVINCKGRYVKRLYGAYMMSQGNACIDTL